jgi:phenylalanyl-tRNA synthetase alpha chain
MCLSDLKQTLYISLKRCLESQNPRPSYFPFTEPSAEVDIYWGLKQKLIIELPKEPVG